MIIRLNVEETINHAENYFKRMSWSIFLAQLGKVNYFNIRKKRAYFINSITQIKKHFFLGTGCNSLKENIDLIRYAMEFGFNTFLLMPPAYYKGNTDNGVYEFYKNIINKSPKVKIILYNFEKLSGYLFNIEIIKKLKKDFPKNIIGCKTLAIIYTKN